MTPTYSFLPWLRSGVANSITSSNNPNPQVRAKLAIDLTVTGAQPGGGEITQVIHQDVSLYGPGDVLGVDPRAIVKVEPRNWITNFEPNLLPYVEFYDEDFPWRYTPAAPTSNKLRPWLALVVLKADEFVNGKNVKDKPLPYFDLATGIDATDVFPLKEQLWAWAHVHVNKDLGGWVTPPTPIGAVLDELQSTLADNPDHACSRILCPRRLEPNVVYHAFLIPAFETGRLAGLGLPIPSNTPANMDAWGNNQAQFPYYHRWFFRTGAIGDFEYLVKLLTPKPADKRVGVRDMDVLHPGANLPPITTPAEIDGVLKLGGALRVPFDTLSVEDQAEVALYDTWDQGSTHPFKEAMAARVNLADDYMRQAPSAVNVDGDPDPVVTSPLYGQWHALTRRLLLDADGMSVTDPDNWVHDLNLDPRFRSAAGLGTKVIQKGQEEYMNAAWEQIGDVLTANHHLRLAQLAMEVSFSLYRKHLKNLSLEKAFVLTAPMHKRIVVQGSTVHTTVAASMLPKAALSAPFRRITRPAARFMKKLGLNTPAASMDIVTGLSQGTLVGAPEKTFPQKAILVEEAVLELDGLGFATDSIREEDMIPASVDDLPMSPPFVLTDPYAEVLQNHGATDSIEATRFKLALKDVYTYTSLDFPTPNKLPLDIPALSAAVLNAIDPTLTVPKRTRFSVRIPFRILDDVVDEFAPVMAHPVINAPMYKPLSDLSTELFLPNINLIPPNSLTLLESNQRFIESYMVGLNHEMARELLWREYPCDQRGSYFRQFWDVSDAFSSDTPTEAEREALRDIPPIHTWPIDSDLGAHNQRETGGDAAQLVLVIRGELLKRYPNAVIYAQKAKWHETNNQIDVTKERELVELSADPNDNEQESLPAAKIRMPLFEAKVDPDIYFIGFDLTAAEVEGGTTATDDPGWFFVIKERPGEPRFGLDEAQGTEPPKLVNWNNLAWTHIGTAPGSHIEIEDPEIQFDPHDSQDQENVPNPDDKQAKWRENSSAADLAYILYQAPVLVAVHASRMLP